MVRLSQRALRDALEFVHIASSAEAAEPFPQETIDLLARLVPGELVNYSEWDSDGPTLTVEQPVVPMTPAMSEARSVFCSSFPLSNLVWSADTRARKISDFLSLRALHRLDYYDLVLRPYRIDHQMRLWLAAPSGFSRVFSFSRRSVQRDFDERDRGLLELLRPFLVTIRERFDLRQAHETKNGDNGLTNREAEILRLVARGMTNREIARILFVSHHTVRKHLEHAYDKLGVHTRTAAIAQLN
jgi:DNA-binding CsgD family transcriptional regulator